jgi:hypothetical protein
MGVPMIVVDDPGHDGKCIHHDHGQGICLRFQAIEGIMTFPYELKLPLAPYRFIWRDEPAVDAAKDATESYTEERYRHADGTTVIIREYLADGSFHIMSDRGEIVLTDNANDPYASDPVSIVALP